MVGIRGNSSDGIRNPCARVSSRLLQRLGASSQAFAISTISPTDLSGLAFSDISTMIQTVGVAADYHDYMPATALGLLLGFDIGIDGTYLAFPSSVQQRDRAGLRSVDFADHFGLLLLPKLNLHKGLPFGIDVGASLSTYSSGGQKVFSSYGGEIKYAFINNMALPTVAVRGSYTSNTLYFLSTSTYTFDVVASKNLILLDPYVGAGLQFWSGSLTVPTGIPQLPASVSANASGSNPHVYGGAMLKLAVLRLDGQLDYSTAGFTTFGGKDSIGF